MTSRAVWDGPTLATRAIASGVASRQSVFAFPTSSRTWKSAMQTYGPTRKVIAKACDACRQRKIKCSGVQPCAGCLSAKLECAFKSPRGQGGNRGVRATVLNKLRANQGNHQVQPRSPSTDGTASTRTSSDVLGSRYVDVSIEMYEERIYPIVPLLNADLLRVEASYMDVSPSSHQLLLAFCAYVANFGNLGIEADSPSLDTGNPEYGRKCLDEAISIQDSRRSIQLTTKSIYISFFLYGAYAGQGNYRQAWFYLREATTLFMMLKNENHPWNEEKFQRRLFWILMISER